MDVEASYKANFIMIQEEDMDYAEPPLVILKPEDIKESINITRQSPDEGLPNRIILPDHVYIGMGIYLTTTGILALIANLMVILVFIRTRHLRVATNLQLLNLSVADIGVVVLAYPLSIRSNFDGRWLFGPSGCQWYGFSGFFFGNASMSTLSLLSFDRYISVCRPKSVFKIRTVKQSLRLLTLIWLFAFAFAILPVVGWSQYNLEPFQTSCTVEWYNHEPEAVSFVCCLTAYITANVAVIIVCYGCIANKVRQHRKTNSIAKVRRQSRPGEQRTAILIALQVFGFLVCWMPYAVTSLWLSYASTKVTSVNLTVLPAMFAKFSPLVNPIVYVAVNYHFRRAFRDALHCRFSSRKNKLPSVESSKTIRVSITENVGCIQCVVLKFKFSTSSVNQESV